VLTTSIVKGGESLNMQKKFVKWLGRDYKLGYLFLIPLLLVIFGLVFYPFLTGILYTFQDRSIGVIKDTFVGFQNYIDIFNRSTYWLVLKNTVIFTSVAVFVKLVIGMISALLLNREFRGRNYVRAILFIPWTLPVLTATLTWKWILDDSGLLNYILYRIGITPISFLSDPNNVLWTVIAVAIWQGTPFYMINILAGLQSIPREIYEAARIDGASAIRQFWHITLPLLRTVILMVVFLSAIWTANSMEFAFILTGGGPAYKSMLINLYAFEEAINLGKLSTGATIAVTIMPFFMILAYYLTKMMFKQSDEVE